MSRRFYVILLAAVLGSLALEVLGATRSLETSAYDARLRLRDPEPWSDDIVLIPIDGPSMDRYGTTPWPRDQKAELHRKLHEAGVSTIVDLQLYAYGETDEADAELAGALDHTVLGAFATRGRSGTGDSMQLVTSEWDAQVSETLQVQPEWLLIPKAQFLHESVRVGHVWNKFRDEGVVRTHIPLLRRDARRALPSVALAAWAMHNDVDPQQITATPRKLRLPGHRPIRLYGGEMLLNLAPQYKELPRVSAGQVLSGAAPELVRRRLEGKLVVVYSTTSTVATPFSSRTPYGELVAEVIHTLNTGAPILVPLWVALIPLIAVAFLVGPMLCNRPLAVLFLSAAGLMSAYMILGLVLVPLFDVFLPVVTPVLAIGLAGLLGSLEHLVRGATAPGSGDARRAPQGQVTLVFTDVERSTKLWEQAPDLMMAALDVHDLVLRETLERAGGYLVKTEGDAFLAAFNDPADAVRWCVAAQEELLLAPWPSGLHEREETRLVYRDGKLVMAGLRVRMGIHTGAPHTRPDPLTGRMDYFGPTVNRTSRICSAAHGGQILISGDAWVPARNQKVRTGEPLSRDLESHRLKGLDDEVRLVELLPRGLSGRIFPDLRVDRRARVIRMPKRAA